MSKLYRNPADNPPKPSERNAGRGSKFRSSGGKEQIQNSLMGLKNTASRIASEPSPPVDVINEYRSYQSDDYQSMLGATEGAVTKSPRPKPSGTTGMISDFNIETDIDAAMEAFAAVESRGSGDYGAVGPAITNKNSMYYGDKALGRYQVMGKNVPEFTKKYFGTELTKEEFLKDEEAQDAVVKGFMRVHYEKYGNIEDAVSKWFTGRTFKKASEDGATDGSTSVDSYVAKFRREFYKSSKKGAES